jgi:ribosomal protein L11 methyltransferase
MIAAGDLTYTCLGGTNFLESSFDRPIRLTNHIIVKPPDKSYSAEPGDVVINIRTGSAFGTGAHPTTHLMVWALDRLFHDRPSMLPAGPLRGLDIGTGSGILAIALACLGVPEVVATDVDPCAVWEARHNISASRVEQQVRITDRAFSTLNRQFSLIAANLSGPTLADLAPALKQKAASEAMLIISGFRDDLLAALMDRFGGHGFAMAGQTTLQGWACLVFKKTEP